MKTKIMKPILKKAIRIFVLAFIAYFMVETVQDWDNNVEAFEEGVERAEMNKH